MYAVIRTGGKQYRVAPNDVIQVERLSTGPGESVDFDEVLLVGEDAATTAGTPLVQGAKVRAEVLEEVRGEKIIVFKKKRRKGYRRKQGHRQNLTVLRITDITDADGKTVSAAKAKAAVKAKPAAKAKAPDKKPVAKPKTETKASETKAPDKKPAAKPKAAASKAAGGAKPKAAPKKKATGTAAKAGAAKAKAAPKTKSTKTAAKSAPKKSSAKEKK